MLPPDNDADPRHASLGTPVRAFLAQKALTVAAPFSSYWLSPNRMTRQGTYLFGQNIDCEKCLALYVGPNGYFVRLSAHKSLAAAQSTTLTLARSRHRKYYAAGNCKIACRAADQWLNYAAWAGLNFLALKRKNPP